MTKVGINGFGRLGRFVFRAAQTRNDIEIVGINDLCPVDYLAYMLKYDTMHGQFEGTIDYDLEKSLLIVNGKKDDGSGAIDKTPDIKDGWYDGICYYMKWDNGNQVGS